MTADFDSALAAAAARPSRAARLAVVAALGDDASDRDLWLALAVTGLELPGLREIVRARRALRSRGVAALAAQIEKTARRHRGRTVELVADPVLVDVRHTAETELATGIQRVARETVGRWVRDHDVTLVTWTVDGSGMRRLTPQETATALHGSPPDHSGVGRADSRLVVPIGGRYVLPELAAETWRTSRLAGLASYGGLRTGVIGFDCVPLTTAETVGAGMPGAFARNLAMLAHVDRVATISEAAATEYRGWRSMLGAVGRTGPDIRSVMLAAEVGEAAEAAVFEFAARAELDDQPLVLVVGSHEPRKNHLAVLHAAELLWAEGQRFRLVFIGGNSWNSTEFTETVQRLRREGRSVVTLSSISDSLLWAAYRGSRFTMFPSINEGFGLPVAESLASGVPVITTGYGSMREIGEGNGAAFVDPRDDDSIVVAMRSLLGDDAELERLRVQAAAYSPRSWDSYAAAVWEYLVEGLDAAAEPVSSAE